jgi:hypothetical protein
MSQSILDIILRSKKQGTGVKDSKEEIDDLGKSTSKFGDIAKGVAVAGVGALVAGLTYAVDQALETERAMRATEQVIKSTGGAAGLTAEEVAGLAGELSALSGVDDEVIQGAENVLLTFTSIGADVFPQATAAALDMSVALGTDLQSAVTMIGKALQDPEKGISALAKVGVNFNDTAKETIKQMVEMNDVAGAQAFILKELNVEFGGMAEAMGNTATGKINKAKNAIDNLSASIGERLLPALGQAADAAVYFIDGVGAVDEVENQYARTVAFLTATQGENSQATQAAITLMREYLQLKQQLGMTDNEARIRAETAAIRDFGAELAAQPGAIEPSNAAIKSYSNELLYNAQQYEAQKVAAEQAAAADAIYRSSVAETTGKIESMAQALIKSTDAQAKQMLAQAALDGIKQAYEKGTISQDGFNRATDAVLLRYDLATPKSLAMAKAQEAITAAFVAGDMPLNNYITAAGKIPELASDGEVSMQELASLGVEPTTEAVKDQDKAVKTLKGAWDLVPRNVKTVYTIETVGSVPSGGTETMGRAGGGPVTESVAVNVNELNRERFVPYASGSMLPATTNNLGPVSIVINGAGQNAQAIAQAVAIELGRMANLAESSGAGMIGM